MRTGPRWRTWPPTRALEIERGEELIEEPLSNEPRAFTSEIDPQYPVFGNPLTSTVRRNFAAARDEIEDLYRRIAEVGGFLAGDVTGAAAANKVERIQGFPVAPIQPLNGQVLMFVAAVGQWVPTTLGTVEPPAGAQWDGGATTWDNGTTTWSS